MSQVSDYDIVNASGAAVRSDINLVLDAIKTLNSGSGDPTNAVAFMLYGDTSDNILKVRNSANSSFTEIGSINEANLGLLPINGNTAMTGSLKLADGSESSPAINFNSDTDTGFYKNGTNSIGVSTGATKRFTVGSYGIELRNGAQFEFRKTNNLNFTAFTASDSISENRTYTLPASDGANGSVLQTNGSGQLSFVAIQGVPTGTIFCFAVASVPAGYLECNGQSTSGHTALAALIGATVPDLRGEFVRGWASNTNDSTRDQGRTILTGQSGDITAHNHTYGNNSITVSGANHKHNIRKIELGQNNNGTVGRVGVTLGSGQGYQIGYAAHDSGLEGDVIKFSGNQTMTGTVGITINNTGGSETRPRNVALMYIIKT